jgi:hypothetical protein
MSINNIATNLVTKGLLNISNITKGLILVSYEIVFKKRGGGGGYANAPKVPLHYERESLFNEIRNHNEEDIDCIKVYVDWSDHSLKGFKIIEAKLLKTHIEAEILNETNSHVTVKIIS